MHTPGPWLLTPGQIPAEYVWDSDGDYRIARVEEWTDWTVTESNGFLIAAAPDLLAAVYALLANATLHPDDCDESAAVAIRNANAAISKAKGRNHV